MTSRERVLAAVDHRQPDRVPVCFGGHRSSGIAAIAYKRLREYLGLEKKPIRVYDLLQQLAVIDDDVLDIFAVDTIEMGRGFALSEGDWKPWVMPDGSDCLIPSWLKLRRDDSGTWFLQSPSGREGGKMTPGMLYFDQFVFPLRDRESGSGYSLRDALSDIVWSNLTPPNLHEINDEDLISGAERFYSSTDRAVIGLQGGSFYETCQFLFGIDHFLMKMALEPEFVGKLRDELLEISLESASKFIDNVGGSIDLIVVSDDLGMQSGLQISPDMYRSLIKPFHKDLYSMIKKKTDARILLHSCGGIEPIYEDLIEAGVDAHNPVQISSSGMDPAVLKERYGDRITFWGGGCDTSSVLPYQSPAQIREHVLRNMDILSPGGGFVFQQVHNIVADIPPENVVAMFNAVKEFNGIS